MSQEEDIVYLKILVFSFVTSLIVKRCGRRDWWNGLIGLGLVVVVCRLHLFYSLGCVLLNLIIIRFAPNKYVHKASFAVSFGYLAFCRCAHFLGLPKPLPHANAVQLIMTLRCIGLAFEVHDTRKILAGGDASEDSSRKRSVPDSLRSFLYLYNFVGLFTGPYYSYAVHSDMVDCQWLSKIPISHEILPRLMITPFYIGLCLFVDTFFPLQMQQPHCFQYAEEERFYANLGILARFLYMVPIFIFLRMRVYVAWTLAESACIANGIGAYPRASKPRAGKGPTDLEALKWRQEKYESEDVIRQEEFSFETVKNVDPYACEFSEGFRSGMRAWNKSVQYWLATYVYKRSPRTIRMPLTMLVSAFWHGIHPGYYLSFLTIPLCTMAEDMAFSIFRKEGKESDGSTDIPHTPFQIVWWFLKMRGFEYMALGFLLLSWDRTVKYWGSLYYFLHVSMITVILLSFAFKTKKKTEKDD